MLEDVEDQRGKSVTQGSTAGQYRIAEQIREDLFQSTLHTWRNLIFMKILRLREVKWLP